ncbi:toll-like receptor 13 [Mytilus galloprovincialis]|uniref:Toll-like receptor 13 n=1 Tax=Mytilus galloprovincialis TaxID=29158 RepID=A0A8B6H706_MYTGA|nr:toll-like receptor 13 [Mytilus galloprovincialis]
MLKISGSITVLLVLLVYVFVARTSSCPKLCTCSRKSGYVSCRDAMLRFVPGLPRYTKELDFSGNRLKIINASTFHNLEGLKLVYFSLGRNGITHITADAFSHFRFLLKLDLSRNSNLTSSMVANAIAQINCLDFKQIILNRMKWSNEPTDLYIALSRFNIPKLEILDNNFENLNLTLLSKTLVQIRELRIGYGMVSVIQPGFFKQLEILDLHYNRIQITKNFFGNETTCFFPKLVKLNLVANAITDVDKLFWCLDNLNSLRLSGNPILGVLNHTFLKLPSLEFLFMSNLGFRFNRIDDTAFKSFTLKHLDLGNNNFVFKSDVMYHFNQTEIFRHSPKIEDLDLSGNRFPSTHIIEKMLSKLQSLRQLYMDNCQLITLPKNLFFKLPKLSFVSFKNNKISSWNGHGIFGIKSSVRTIILTGNALSTINKTLFPRNALKHLSTLSLGNNPFACTCSNVWFHNWLQMEKSIFKKYPELYHCKTPPEKDGELIKDAIPTHLECSTDNELFTAIVTSLSLSGIVFVIIFSIIFRLRWHIRYWLYLFRVKKKGFSLISNEETDYIFEAYLIYCDNDLQWIQEKLLEKIEKESGISLCIRDRDFEVGKVYVENIIEKMNSSRRIILVISHDMVKSNWCLFESRIAQEKCLNKESDALISLIVEHVSEENMSSSLRAFVNSASLSKFPAKEYDQEQFWLNLTKLLRNQR